MRCHLSSVNRSRTGNFEVRLPTAVNLSPDFLIGKRVARLIASARASRAVACDPPLRFRFIASSIGDLQDPFDAGAIATSHDDPLVSCIDAERAAI